MEHRIINVDRLAAKHRGEDAQVIRRALRLLQIQKARIQLTQDRALAGKMQDDTPYHRRHAGEIAREEACKTYLFQGAPAVREVLECFGGIGMTGEVLARSLPKASMVGVDLDARCVREYNKKLSGRGRAFKADASDFLQSWHPTGTWAASLDFNKFTLLDLTERVNWRTALVDDVVSRSPRWVHISDSACKYLHMNWSQYGLEDSRFLTYIHKLDWWIDQLWGMRVHRVVRHSNASHSLLLPEAPRRRKLLQEVSPVAGLEFYSR